MASGGVTWLEHPGSRLAHAIRETPVKVAAPGIRLSLCGRVAWHRTAHPASPTQTRCANCSRAPMPQEAP